MTHGRLILGAVVTLLFTATAFGHEVRPAYLELREEAPGAFRVLWKTPARGEARLDLTPVFSGDVEVITPVVRRDVGGAAVQTWRIRATGPLRGQAVRVQGLEGTMTDALVRIAFVDGSTWVRRLTAREPATTIPTRREGGRSLACISGSASSILCSASTTSSSSSGCC